MFYDKKYISCGTCIVTIDDSLGLETFTTIYLWKLYKSLTNKFGDPEISVKNIGISEIPGNLVRYFGQWNHPRSLSLTACCHNNHTNSFFLLFTDRSPYLSFFLQKELSQQQSHSKPVFHLAFAFLPHIIRIIVQSYEYSWAVSRNKLFSATDGSRACLHTSLEGGGRLPSSTFNVHQNRSSSGCMWLSLSDCDSGNTFILYFDGF